MRVDKAFIISLLVLAGVFFLRATNNISEDMFYGIVTSILAYWLGRTHGRSEVRGCALHNNTVAEIVRYMGYIMMCAGVGLTFHHFMVYGYSWDLVALCHGLYGWILFTVGFVLSAKWRV